MQPVGKMVSMQQEKNAAKIPRKTKKNKARRKTH